MNSPHLIAYFFGGLFLSNAIPHFVSGVLGRPFQTPFAKPSGIGLSSSTVNVLWGTFNAAVAYVLLLRIGTFNLRSPACVVPFALGAILISLFAARHFGKFHGGTPRSTNNEALRKPVPHSSQSYRDEWDRHRFLRKSQKE